MSRPWWYRLLCWVDGYWHVYVCNLVERYADEPFVGPDDLEKAEQE